MIYRSKVCFVIVKFDDIFYSTLSSYAGRTFFFVWVYQYFSDKISISSPIPSFPVNTIFTSHIFTYANQNYEYAKNEKRSEQIVKATFQFFTVYHSRIYFARL